IVDIASEMAAEQCRTVEDLLADLGLSDKPRLVALNKIDLLGGEVRSDDEETVRRYVDHLGARIKSAALISAAKGWGLRRLLELIGEMLDDGTQPGLA
ncbi:MAG: GTPase HflX, partial [Dehalococcoidia bacterium]